MTSDHLFFRFIHQYPNSFPAVEWKNWGEAIPKHSSGFVVRLYQGDIWKACAYVDEEHAPMLAHLLFPGLVRDPTRPLNAAQEQASIRRLITRTADSLQLESNHSVVERILGNLLWEHLEIIKTEKKE